MAIGMKKYARLLDKPYAAYTFAACSAVVLFMLLSNLDVINGWISGLGKLLSPVFTGIAVAYLFNPLSDFFERKWLKKIKKDTARHLSMPHRTPFGNYFLIGLSQIGCPFFFRCIRKSPSGEGD